MARPQSATDDEILDAAEAVMAERGPEGFSVSEVARQVGLSRAAISFRFDSPDGLKRSTFARAIGQVEHEVGTWSIVPGGDGLLEVAGGIGRMVSGRRGFARYILRFGASVDDPATRDMELQRGRIIREAVAKAMPEARVSRGEAVDAFMAHITGSLIAWRARPDGDAESFLRERTQIWLRMTGLAASGDGA